MKNRYLYMLTALALANFCPDISTMNNQNPFNQDHFNTWDREFRNFQRDFDRIQREHQEKLQKDAAQREKKKADLDEKLRNGNDAEKQDALAEKELLRKKEAAADKERQNVEDIGKRVADIYVDIADNIVNAAKDAQKAELEKQKTAIKEEMRRRAVVDGIKTFFNSLSEPKTATGVALCSLGIFGSYYGLKFGFKVLEDWYGVPELADKTTIIPFHKQMYNKIMGIQVFNKTRNDIVLNNELKEFMNEYIEGTKNIIAHGGYLNHVLFPGPPGTGKTLMAEVIANELGLPSIYFAASNLLNCDTEKALVRLSQLFTYAKSSPTPIVIIMDEAEMIFGDRNKAASEKVSTIKNQIMANTGTEQNNFILIALTNRLQDFDKAFKSRFNNIVEVTPPAYAQRKQILELYVNQYIVNPKFKTKGTFLGKLFTKKNAKKITYDATLFSAQGIETLANQLDGFTGRNISHFVMDIRKKALASNTTHISQATIDKALVAMKAKVAEEQREFAAGTAGK